MKSRLTILLSILLLVGCTLDYKDEIHPAKEDGSATGKLTVNVCVSGVFASDDTAAEDSECSVSKYDLLVFDESTGQLQYQETGITPSTKESIAGTSDFLLDTKEMELPNAGQKRVIVIANGETLNMPKLVTSTDDYAGCTLLNEFRSEVTQTLTAAPQVPLVMVGETCVATSNGTALPVTLSRTVARIKVVNKNPDAISLSSISVKGASASYFPLEMPAEMKTTATIDYDIEIQQGTDHTVFYVLPTAAEKMTITANGTVSGTAFTAETLIQTDIYADYGCRLEYSISDANVKSTFYPEFGVEKIPPITVSGEWLSGETEITLPFIAEPTYGFTFDVSLEEGYPAATVSKNDEAADWYDVAIEENRVRVRALKENNDNERASSFDITSGGSSLNITIKQQGVKDINTVTFAGIEWMDRNLGATARANMAGSSDIKSYGYLYQWGRNIPFPVVGTVETVAGQKTPQEAMQTNQFIVYNEGTQDWNSQGIEGTYEDTWEKVNQDPCPEGYRLPTYSELETILPYRVVSLIYAAGRQNKTITKADGSTYQYVGFGIGAISQYQSTGEIRGIMNQGTDDAYYLKWQFNNEGGTMIPDPNNSNVNYISGGKNILRISYIDGNSSSDFPKIADANNFWTTNTPEQDLYFPCPGRRDATGTIVESGTSAFYWTGSMYKGNKTTEAYASGLLYFRPAGKYMLMTAPAIGAADVYTATEEYGYRNQAFSIRCVKDK